MNNNINEFIKILVKNDVLDKPVKTDDISKVFNELNKKELITDKELEQIEKGMKQSV